MKIDSVCLDKREHGGQWYFKVLTTSKCRRDGVFLSSSPTYCTVKMSHVGRTQENIQFCNFYQKSEEKDHYSHI